MKKWVIHIILFCSYNFALAGNITIELGKSNIALNESFTISIVANNATITNYSDFPHIKGFRRSNPFSSMSSSNINGVKSSSHRIYLQYYPTKKGSFKLNPFEIRVNGTNIKSKGSTIVVGPKKSGYNQNSFGFFQSKPQKPRSFDTLRLSDKKLNTFFKVSTDKDTVYVREGVNVRLSLFIQKDQFNYVEARGNWDEQILKIEEDIKQNHCLVENFNLQRPQRFEEEIDGIVYYRYDFYEAMFFPFSAKDIVFPKITFYADKFYLLHDKATDGYYKDQEKILDLEAEYKTIYVKDLPDHPLKNDVSVGSFVMQEKSSSAELQTGEVFSYGFLIRGEGNIAGIEIPTIENDSVFTFLAPELDDQIEKKNHRISGGKVINYSIIPNKPGKYNFGDYFSWVYFNTKSHQYDTLRSQVQLNVKGENIKRTNININDSYKQLFETADNSTYRLDSVDYFKIFVNSCAVAAILLTGFVWYKRKKKDE